MDPITLGLLIGAGTGLVKSQAIDQPAAQRQAKMQAEFAKMSPWSKIQADPGAVTAAQNQANPFSAMLQMGAAGAMAGYMKSMAAKPNASLVTNNVGTDPSAFAADTPDSPETNAIEDSFNDPSNMKQLPADNTNPYQLAGIDPNQYTHPNIPIWAKNDSWLPPIAPAQYVPGNNYGGPYSA